VKIAITPTGKASINTMATPVDLQDNSDIREAVFRHLFEHNASGQQKKLASAQ
jgi:hypothetical protein